jgi:hypothetical protein
MSNDRETVLDTKGGPLTTDDFESEAPSPGTSDGRYSGAGKKSIKSIADRVKKFVKDNAAE